MSLTKTEFERLYLESFPDVRRFVFHLVHDDAIADELTQDTYVRAHEGRSQFRGEAPPRVWLFRIARNVSLDFLRSPRARSRQDRSLEGAAADGSLGGSSWTTSVTSPAAVEDAARRNEMSECVQEFVKSLPEALRTPLLLHDLEGFTNGEIASVTGCSLQAAKMRLHRARAALRRMMEERCDLFHDERNVLSCLPLGPSLRERGFVSLADLDSTQP